jgi:hypothetical protein
MVSAFRCDCPEYTPTYCRLGMLCPCEYDVKARKKVSLKVY